MSVHPGPSTLRELRAERHLSMEAVAYLGEVDVATVSRLERGLVQPRPATVVKLARGLGISVSRMSTILANSADLSEQAAQ